MEWRLSLLTAVLCEDVAPYVPLFGRPQSLDPRALPLAQPACHGRLAPWERGAWGERAPWPRASCRLFALLRPHHTAPRSLLTETADADKLIGETNIKTQFLSFHR